MILENAKRRYKHFIDRGQTERAEVYLEQLGDRGKGIVEERKPVEKKEVKKDAKKSS